MSMTHETSSYTQPPSALGRARNELMPSLQLVSIPERAKRFGRHSEESHMYLMDFPGYIDNDREEPFNTRVLATSVGVSQLIEAAITSIHSQSEEQIKIDGKGSVTFTRNGNPPMELIGMGPDDYYLATYEPYDLPADAGNHEVVYAINRTIRCMKAANQILLGVILGDETR